MRISLGFALVVISIILVSDMLGMIPDPGKAQLEGRQKLAETLAVQYSIAATRNNYDVITSSMKMLVERNEDVISAGLRNTYGELLAVAGDHRNLWEEIEDGSSNRLQMQVPIFKDRQLRSKWATVELRFVPDGGTQVFGYSLNQFVLMIIFVAGSAFVSFLLLIKKIFTNIDPGSVVPTRVRRALDTLTEGVLLIDLNGKIMFTNRVFCTFAMVSTNELLGKKAASFNWVFAGDELPWDKTLRNGVSGVRESLTLVAESGARRKFMVNCSMVTDDKGDGQGVMVTFDDVTELDAKNDELKGMLSKLKESAEQINRHNDELRILAMRDPLTGCLNRRSLFENYESVYFESRTSGQPFACLMMDIDHFKSINDNYGHAVGDEVLKKVSGALQAVMPDGGVVFRYGGEEFCILLTADSGRDATSVAEKVRVAIESMSVYDAQSVQHVSVTTSLGVSHLNDSALNLSILIDQADKALYVSKNSGRNRVTVWSDSLHDNEQADSETPVGDAGVIERRSTRATGGDHPVLSGGMDDTTGLPDRSSFQQNLAGLMAYTDSSNTSMAVVMLDVDMFQRLNFALGHAAGDRILRLLAERLQNSLRATDIVNHLVPGEMSGGIFRLGGDEFGVLLTDIDSTEHVETIIGRITAAIARPVSDDGHEIYITCSAGISLYPKDGGTEEQLITHAALALRQAQRSGIGSICFYDEDYALNVKRDYQIENDLRYAIENDELELYYQPKLDINTLEITSMEALVRWNHPDTGMRMPGEFISAAEASGLINPMGKWVMEEACRQVNMWQEEGYEMPVSINLSPVQFRQHDLVEQINNAVAAARIEPRYIELEITENAIMKDVDASMEVMGILSRHGYRISIDDFGIGYSSLEHLKRYPIDILKIDRCFVQEIDLGQSELAIARAIVDMAHSMGLDVVAEGVETESQLLALREINCDKIQGYLMGPPLPARDAIRLVDENTYQVSAAI
jgi:diguanylate cyclase (GGDEF)-like protein/PAS domain S-box-containing protein